MNHHKKQAQFIAFTLIIYVCVHSEQIQIYHIVLDKQKLGPW